MRKTIAFVLLSLLAILLVGFSYVSPEAYMSFISPGDLAGPHQAIGGCSSCHSEGQGQAGSVLARLSHPDVQGHLGAACADCHKAEAKGGAHNRRTDENASMRSGQTDRDASCLTCHAEHKGAGGLVDVLQEETCNDCHRKKIADFDSSHPPLPILTKDRSGRLAFNHDRHFKKHFGQVTTGRVPESCIDCHQVESDGRSMSIRPFKDSCGQCHGGMLRNKDLAILAIPGLDVSTLKAKGIAIGQWPDGAEAQGMPVFADVLSAGFPGYSAARQHVQNRQLDLLDLEDADSEDLAAVKKIAWGFKHLLGELVSRGPEGFAARLDGQAAEADLVSLLPYDLFSAMAEVSFPDLAAELERFETGEPPATRLTRLSGPSSRGDLFGWRHEYGTIAYRSAGHQDQQLAQALLDFLPPAAAGNSASEAAVTHFMGVKGPAPCAYCHDLADHARQTSQETKPLIAWNGLRPGGVFHHEPHLVGKATSCATCHAPVQKDDVAKIREDFTAPSLETCRSCHGETAMDSQCLDCHRYHYPGDAAQTTARQ
ncbi:MAG: cytochrome c3 family protein [Magnetovibrionaceae bacterium]